MAKAKAPSKGLRYWFFEARKALVGGLIGVAALSAGGLIPGTAGKVAAGAVVFFTATGIIHETKNKPSP